jgi:MFS family permease
MTTHDAAPPRGATALLRLREFRALTAAVGIAGLAFSALTTVVAFQVYDLTRDPLALGWLGLVEGIPALALALYGGHVADRMDRRSIVLVTSATATLAAAALAILALGTTPLLGVLGVIFVIGVAAGFERPALTALQAQVIPREDAARGVSIMNGTSQTGFLAGPALGGIAIAIVGVPLTYVGLAVLLAVATGCLLFIERRPVPELAEDEPIGRSLLGGVRYVVRTPALLASMALDLFAVFFGGAVALLPIFAADVLQVGPVGLGVLRTAPSVGALGAMVVAARWPPGRHAGRTLLIAVAGFGISMIVFGLSTVFVVSVVALVAAGITDGVSMVIRSTILRVLSPERIRGRVAAVNWVFIGASNELGAFESGIAARLFGAAPAVIGGALVTLGVVGAVAALVPSLRSLDLDTAEPTEPDEPTEPVAIGERPAA